MKIKPLDETLAEADEAFDYYEEINPALGMNLRLEMEHYLRQIQQHPEVPPLRRNLYRRVNLRTFPYYFAYLIHDDTIWLLTFAHTARRPEYWLGRAGRWGR